jgi:hypothetical protein
VELQKNAISPLTDAIASCNVGLGFLLVDDPKIRFIVKTKRSLTHLPMSCIWHKCATKHATTTLLVRSGPGVGY